MNRRNNMPKAARLTDKSECLDDSHGNICCPHHVVGEAIDGSPNVNINGLKALRVGDKGTHSGCCGSNTWTCTEGSSTVFINGKPAVRLNDETKHCGGTGKIITGSNNVFIGG